MVDEVVVDQVYEKTLTEQIQKLSRVDQIKRYIELYKELKGED